MHHDDLDVTDDLRDVASLLRQQRAELGGVELDRIKQRAMGLRSRSSTSPVNRKSTFMRSRSVITALLASGIVMSGGSAALGVSALVANDSASVAQYGAPVAPSSVGPVAPSSGTLADNATGTGPGTGSGSVAPSSQQGAANATPRDTTSVAGASAQPVRQFAATTTRSGQLPFTGFAAIPVLLIGLVLLASGVFLRRGARRSPTQL